METPINSDHEEKQNILRRELIGQLTQDQREKVLGKLIGYKTLPPGIDEILDSDYYLKHISWNTDGTHKMYPIWKDRLKEMYPDRIRTKSTIIVARGALGTGKSYFSIATMVIDLIKWGFHPDPYQFLGLDKAMSPTFIRMFNIDKTRSQSVLVDPMLGVLERSPYFLERRRDTGEWYPHNIQIRSARRSNDVISEVVLGAVISEVNFFHAWQVQDIIDTVLGRLKSRMQKSLGLFSHVIIDSSDTDEESAVDEFLNNSGGWKEDTTTYTTNIWTAKSHLGIYFLQNPPSFKVYCGDSGKSPFIIPEGYNLNDNSLDPDRILDVPSELRPSYDIDIVRALQESAGISVSIDSKFFNDKDRLVSRFNIQTSIPEIITLDFFDKEELWDLIGSEVLRLLPKDRKIYGRLDLGVVNDLAGLSLGFGAEVAYTPITTINDDGENVTTQVLRAKYDIPVAFALSRIPGQETNIGKIARFFITLSKYREIGIITTDQYQSTQLRQMLTEQDIPNALMSVDRNDDAYVISKNLVLQELVRFCINELFKMEALKLERHGRKIDHSNSSSKDICDAAFGVLFSMYKDNLDAFTQVSVEKLKEYGDLLDIMAKKNISRFYQFRR